MSAAGLLYAGILMGGLVLSSWAERDLQAFPFKQEDWLRYLIPSTFAPKQRPTIMLAGPSTVRENLRYERFEDQFPSHDVFQGGMSLGTIEDVTASLEYIEKVYGADVLPTFIVLGVAPRFIANVPDKRPFRIGLDRYSPYFSTRQEATSIELVPKGWIGGLESAARFVTGKQPERIRTALAAVANYVLSDPPSDAGGNPLRYLVGTLFEKALSPRLLNMAGLPHRISDYSFFTWLEWWISPYKYSLTPPYRYTGPLRDRARGWWPTVYRWNPEAHRTVTMARLKRFTDFANRHEIRLVVINMPERDINRAMFEEKKYNAYLDIVRQSFGGAPVVNLREFLRADEFFDLEHSVVPGSIRLTDAVINYLKTNLPELGAVQRRQIRASSLR